MKKIISVFTAVIFIILSLSPSAFAFSVPRPETPEYKVAFYSWSRYHIIGEDGKMSGYGYELMQNISEYMQCTFSYEGYDKTPDECIEMLRNGEIDLYTASAMTEERLAEFAFTTHRAIVATTYLNVKAGNHRVIPGNYDTYNGMKIGLLSRHSYNPSFIDWANAKGFSYDIVYYETQDELSSALINGEIDALLNSYIRSPDDERTIENFGQTPYYIIARKKDSSLIEQIDSAIDEMNIETPNKRTELYNKYFGATEHNLGLTKEETELLHSLKEQNAVIKAVMKPDAAPYSWYEDGEAYGISADFFKAVADKLGLRYEIIPVSDRTEYNAVVNSGEADVLINTIFSYEEEGDVKYKLTKPYHQTSVSILRKAGMSSSSDGCLIIMDKNIAIDSILSSYWPNAEIIMTDNTKDCLDMLLHGKADGAFLMTYMAQTLARSDTLNRFNVDIVPGAYLELRMGVNADCDINFYGLIEKTLAGISDEMQTQTVHYYTDTSTATSIVAYLFDHPTYLLCGFLLIIMMLLFLLLYIQSAVSRRKQQKTSDELKRALENVREATEAKDNFFSRMSHDIRTPLNVVLGMTQIAIRYKNNPDKLSSALNAIKSEGNYLLGLINSILDVNQLEHGHIELADKPFNPALSVKNVVTLLSTLAESKKQKITLNLDFNGPEVLGDESRFSQITLNIISNAIKYTEPEGLVDITLSSSQDGTYRFICRDNGIGMTRELIEHITEEYVRAEDSRVSKTQGTGLGMAVVKGLLNLMNGSLSVESELGKGSVFTVEIPFRLAEKNSGTAYPESDTSNTSFNNKKVLLAEDNDLNAHIASELLLTLGLSSVRAQNGLEAVEMFENSEVGEYFAIFMDMQMPVMDGVEAARKIRASEKADKSIPIYAMTANTFAGDIRLCLDSGMTGYISKPIDIDEIAAVLKESIK